MSCLCILHTESSTGLGGEEYRILAETVGMARRGHRVLLALPPNSQLRPLAEREGVPVESVAMRPQWVFFAVLKFLRMIARHQPDVIVTHGSMDSWAASIAGRLSRAKPAIIRIRHKSTAVSRGIRHRFLYRRLPHALVTTGEAIRLELMRSQGIASDRIVSIPTGVDVERFRPEPADPAIRRQLGLLPDHMLVGIVAFLRSYKGLDYFIDAAPLVIAVHAQARFLIVGDGPERESLAKKIKRLGLESHVMLAGFREDIPRVLAAMDLFVLSSVGGEGLPQSLTQAMAMQRPVVATDVGSVGEVVEDGITGLLVPPRNAAALADGINRMLGERELRDRLARAGLDRIVHRYSKEWMLAQTEELYGRLLVRIRMGTGAETPL